MLETPDQSGKADEELVVSVLRGEQEAFSSLYRRYYRRAYRLAYGMTGNPDAAEDMTQDIFLQAYRALKFFRGESRFSTWFHRLAINCCLNDSRRQRRSRNREIALGLETSRTKNALEPVEANLLQAQLQAEVHRALLSLKPRLRLIVILKDMQGLSYDEIAERAGCSKGTVGSRLNRARKLLARKLAKLESSI